MEKEKQKRWTAARKAELVIASLSGNKTVAELCRESGIPQSTFFAWKKAFLEAGTNGLKGAGQSSREAELEQKLAQAERKIGEMTLDKEVMDFAKDFVKKKGWS
ncbi:MAG: transposase [Erythrobacter sp.]|nr:transposase [Erythrobacter sp.]